MKRSSILLRSGLCAGLLLAFGTCAPKAATPALVLGAQTHLGQGRMLEAPRRLMRSDLGLTFVRDEIYWETVERSEGVFDWKDTDARMKAIADSGAKLLLTLNWSNSIHDPGPAEGAMPDNGIALPDTPGERAAFVRYVMAVLDRYADPEHGLYPGMIIGLEVWNEANGSWGGGYVPEDVAQPLTALTLAVSQAVRASPAYADLPIAGCAAVGSSLRYTTRCLDAGMAAGVDAIVVHPYDDLDTAFRNLSGLKRLLESRGLGRIAIWATEYASPNRPGDLIKLIAMLRSVPVELASYYPGQDMDSFPGLIGNAGELSDVGLVFERYASRFAASTPTGRTPSQPGTYILNFVEPSGANLVAAWSDIGPTRLAVAGKAEMSGIEAGTRKAGATVELGLTPVVISGARSVTEDMGDRRFLADSKADFEPSSSGAANWRNLGVTGEGVEIKLALRPDDWGDRAENKGLAALFVSSNSMHPGWKDNGTVNAVRRWVSPQTGRLRIVGRLSRGEGGDGTGFEIRHNGRQSWGRLLKPGDEVQADVALDVVEGEFIDFVATPGPAADVSFDAVGMRFGIYAEAAPTDE